RDSLESKGAAVMTGEHVKRLANGCEHTQSQDVDLEEAQTFDVFLAPLDDGASFHGRRLLRHQVVERPFGEHEAARVDAEVTREAFELVGELAPKLPWDVLPGGIVGFDVVDIRLGDFVHLDLLTLLAHMAENGFRASLPEAPR